MTSGTHTYMAGVGPANSPGTTRSKERPLQAFF